MKYDHPDYHWSNEFPEGLDEDNAMTHMGFFFSWALQHGLISDFHLDDTDTAEQVQLVKNGSASAREYVIANCDSQLTNEDLTDQGNDFANEYYVRDFFDDYTKLFADQYESPYHVEENSANSERVRRMLDERFSQWKERQSKKPWWRLW